MKLKNAPHKGKVFCFVPFDLCLENLDGFDLGFPSRISRIKLKFTLSTIYYFSVVVNRYSQEHYVTINSKYWKKILGNKDYTKYLLFLEANSIIDIDHSYQQDVTTKGFRINKQFAPNTCKWVVKKFSYPILRQKLDLIKKAAQESYIILSNVNYDALNRAYNSVLGTPRQKVPQPSTGALNPQLFTESRPYDWIKKTYMECTSFSPEIYSQIEGLEIESQNSMNVILHYLAEKNESWWTIGEKSWRLFYPIANTKSNLRPLIEINENPTKEIDIKSSQPFFAATLYKESSNERDKYIDCLESGFYELFSFRIKGRKDRKKIKKKVFKEIFFGGYFCRGEIYSIFKDEFPELAGIMNRQYPPTGKSNSKLAIHLQQMEAMSIFAAVGKLKELNIPCLTVHDSIITKSGHSIKAKEVLNNEILYLTGLRAIIQ